MNIVKFLLNLIFPPRCVFCNEMLEPDHSDSVCARCRLEIRLCADYLCCEKCGKPVASYGEKKKCYSCLENIYNFDRAAAVLIYEGNARYSIIRNKRRSIAANVSEFARLMSLTVQMNYEDISFDGIVSAPSYVNFIQKNERNHIEPISEKLSELLEVPHIKRCLHKIKKTPKQSSLNYEQRRTNLLGSIACQADVKGKTLLLIDDVLTTGSTADECARVLKENGAEAVYVVTLATSVKEHVV